MWGKIMIPMYRLWLHGLYGLHGPRCPLSPKGLLNLITRSLTPRFWSGQSRDLWLNKIRIPVVPTKRWGLLKQFPPFHYFHQWQNTGNLLNITFIFDRCCHSWAVATPIKYESDLFKEIIGYFHKIKYLINGDINKPSFSCPHPGSIIQLSTPSNFVVSVKKKKNVDIR